MEAKKYKKADINRYRIVFFNIGLILSLGLTYTAFEWKFYDNEDVINANMLAKDNFEEVYDIPPTEQPPPPPPEMKNINIVSVEDNKLIEDELEVSFDIEMTEDMISEPIPEDLGLDDEMEDEESEEIFVIVEEQPHPVGGMNSFYKYINKTIKYPSNARRMGIQGRVFVQFVIEKDGSISQVEVIRGISSECDNEAVRVVKNAPPWKPGKQRGKPVRVKMVLPISFKLS